MSSGPDLVKGNVVDDRVGISASYAFSAKMRQRSRPFRVILWNWRRVRSRPPIRPRVERRLFSFWPVRESSLLCAAPARPTISR